MWPHHTIQEEQEDNRDKVEAGGRGAARARGEGAQGIWKVADLAGLLRQASVSLLPAATRTATPAFTTSATAKSSAYWGSPALAVNAAQPSHCLTEVGESPRLCLPGRDSIVPCGGPDRKQTALDVYRFAFVHSPAVAVLNQGTHTGTRPPGPNNWGFCWYNQSNTA